MGARRVWLLTCVLAVLSSGLTPVAAQDSGPAQLTLELRNLARVPPDLLRATLTEVDRTFLASGVRVEWTESASASGDPTRLRVFVVSGATSGPRIDDARDVVVGLAPQSGSWAQVYYRRVVAAVAERQVPLSVVLAHVISHELGHLLLPPNSHASVGIMRRVVDLEHPALRRFTDEQSQLIRAAVASGQRYWSRCDH